MTLSRQLFLSLASLLLVSTLAACGRSDPVSGGARGDDNNGAVQIRVLSNRADLISSGDALLEVKLPAGADASKLKVIVAGADASAQFLRRADGRVVGLVSGMAIGANTITASLPGTGAASVTLTNHPHGGPVFAGPQLQPWTCLNEGAVDAQCNQPPEYAFVYKSSNPLLPGLQPYDPESPPADVAETTTDQGVTVPFIVRVETGYQDRDQYKIAALYQPEQPWTGAAPQPQFNRKLLINHGFSCGVQYQTGEAPPVTPSSGTDTPIVGGELLPVGLPLEVLKDATEYALGLGYAVMSTALDHSAQNCNVALQAESLVMAKERVIEQYGELRYTVGEGCSGGSLAQQQIANAYPGIYQGILPTCSFPDAWSTATQFLDYHLTLDYFLDPSQWGGVAWLPTQMAAVQDHLTIANSEVSDSAQFHVAVPTDPCGGISDEQRYHPDTNPGGTRCSVQDAAINLLGPRPPALWTPMEQQIGRGFAGFPLDNIGVQYGLKALQQGLILPAQFVDLNVKIGGADQDANVIDERVAAVQPALANAYRTGMINEGNNMDEVAIIDCRGPDPGAFHDAYRAYAMRARLDRAHGHHDNQLIWEGPVPILGDNSCARNSFIAMDRWLTAVEQDSSTAPIAQKLVTNKPADLQDACFDGLGQKLTDGICGPLVVGIYGTPRTGAGDAITTDTNKCQLKPLDRTDNYGPQAFTDEQWAQLQAVFPDGVCDFSKPGVSQQPTIAWMAYGNASTPVYGGRPLPAVPASSGLGWASPAFQVFAAP
ncbi:MAG TPA: DUF6351 family protein [Solimonas sp.]|nr:DUF6351 family protein [Solimonas sp.]